MNKGYDQVAFLIRDNDKTAYGWKYGMVNASPVTRFTKPYRASDRDYTQWNDRYLKENK